MRTVAGEAANPTLRGTVFAVHPTTDPDRRSTFAAVQPARRRHQPAAGWRPLLDRPRRVGSRGARRRQPHQRTRRLDRRLHAVPLRHRRPRCGVTTAPPTARCPTAAPCARPQQGSRRARRPAGTSRIGPCPKSTPRSPTARSPTPASPGPTSTLTPAPATPRLRCSLDGRVPRAARADLRFDGDRRVVVRPARRARRGDDHRRPRQRRLGHTGWPPPQWRSAARRGRRVLAGVGVGAGEPPVVVRRRQLRAVVTVDDVVGFSRLAGPFAPRYACTRPDRGQGDDEGPHVSSARPARPARPACSGCSGCPGCPASP